MPPAALKIRKHPWASLFQEANCFLQTAMGVWGGSGPAELTTLLSVSLHHSSGILRAPPSVRHHSFTPILAHLLHIHSGLHPTVEGQGTLPWRVSEQCWVPSRVCASRGGAGL